MKTRILIAFASATLLMAASAAAQNLFETDWGSGKIYEFIESHGILSTNPTLFASGLNNPAALAFNSTGDLYEADWGSGIIYKFADTNGVLSTAGTAFAAGLNHPSCLAFDRAGDLFVGDNWAGTIKEFIYTNSVLSTTPTLFASGLGGPMGLAFDSAGNLFEADFAVTNTDGIYEFINNNGALSLTPTLFASGLGPDGLAFDSAGDLFVTDLNNGSIKEFISTNGLLSTTPVTIASGLTEPGALAFDSYGDLFEADYAGGSVYGSINEFVNYNGILNHHPTVLASKLGPSALAFVPSPARMRGGSLTVKKLQAKVNFNPMKPNKDTCSLTAVPALPSGFSVTNQTVTVDIGDVVATFTLNAKGSSKSSTNSCKLTYAKKTKLWTLTASMKNGSWVIPWAEYGVINVTGPKVGLTLRMPVTATIGTNTFGTIYSLHYKATSGKSGTLK